MLTCKKGACSLLMTTLSRYLGCLPDSTNFFYYHYLVMIQATSSINIHVESLITISAELSTVYNFLV